MDGAGVAEGCGEAIGVKAVSSGVDAFFLLRVGGAADEDGFFLDRLDVEGVGADRFGFWVRRRLPNPN